MMEVTGRRRERQRWGGKKKRGRGMERHKICVVYILFHPDVFVLWLMLQHLYCFVLDLPWHVQSMQKGTSKEISGITDSSLWDQKITGQTFSAAHCLHTGDLKGQTFCTSSGLLISILSEENTTFPPLSLQPLVNYLTHSRCWIKRLLNNTACTLTPQRALWLLT